MGIEATREQLKWAFIQFSFEEMSQNDSYVKDDEAEGILITKYELNLPTPACVCHLPA